VTSGQVGDRGVGLCVRCQHARTVETARGSRFWLCRLSVADPRFPRYPTLPVVSCIGFREAEEDSRS